MTRTSKRVTPPGQNTMPQFEAKHDTWSATGVPRAKARSARRGKTKLAKASRRGNR